MAASGIVPIGRALDAEHATDELEVVLVRLQLVGGDLAWPCR